MARLCWRNLTRLLLVLSAVALLTLLLAWLTHTHDPFLGCARNGDVILCE